MGAVQPRSDHRLRHPRDAVAHMTPLIEPELEMAKVVREAYERVIANATKDQGQDWVASAVRSSQQPGARASVRGVRAFQTIAS